MSRTVALVALILLPVPGLAQIQSFTVRGTVDWVDQNKDRIVMARRTYHVGQACKIWRNDKPDSFSSVKAKQEIEITYTRYPGGRREANIVKTWVSAEAEPVATGPQIFPSTAKPGDYGRLATKDRAKGFQVFQIVGKNDALIQGDGVTFRLQGVPTANMAEGRAVDLAGCFKVTQTSTYETSNGTTKTVPIIEPMSEEEKKQIEEAHRKKLQTAAESDEARKREAEAARKLRLAKQLLEHDQQGTAKSRLSEIVEQFAGTKAAKEAQQLLEKLP